jgi:hypothetical protein
MCALSIADKNGFTDPKLIKAFGTIEATVNSSLRIAGVNAGSVAAAPVNSGSLTVTEGLGIYDAVISDPANERGETYFLEWDTQPSFVTARMIQLGASRYWRGQLSLGVNSYWRFYKQLVGSNVSAWINFGGTTPAAVGFGGAAAPALGVPSGSGSSSQSGQGLGPIGAK